jgi:hypothetical protein
LLVAACLFTAGCSGSSDTDTPASSGGSSGGGSSFGLHGTLDIYEAAFRHQLQKFPCTPDAAAHLSIDGRDIPAELMARLRRDWPNLKQLSEGDKDKVLRVFADNLQREGNDGAVTLKVGYWFPTKYAGQSEFGDHRFVRKGGTWVLESVTNQVIGCG